MYNNFRANKQEKRLQLMYIYFCVNHCSLQSRGIDPHGP